MTSRLLRPARVAASLACILASACAAPKQEPAAEPPPAKPTAAPPAKTTAAPPTAAKPAGPPEAGQSRVLVGTLRYTEIPAGVQSVAAFRSEDLTLVGEGGESWNLAGSGSVTEEQLIGLAGKRIEVTATYVPPSAPDPGLAAPMNGDAPMEYPARWDVTAVRTLGP